MKFTVSVPASTSNLGAGFDALGLALKLYNDFIVEPADFYSAEIKGEGEEELPTDEKNLFIRAYRSTMEYLGKNQPIKVKQINRIPLGRGLGSSATAIVGGILAAQKISGKELSLPEVIDIAFKFEPHPDNVLPAYTGGFVVAATNGDLTYLKLDWPKELKIIIVVPELFLSTEESRSVLPETYPRKDVIFNIQRVALLLGALQKKDYSLLKEAVKDRIHQPYRCDLIPSFWEVLSEGYRAGAYAVYLSGAGSCIGAIADKNFDEIGKAMTSVFDALGIESRYMVLDVDENGAEIKE
ncbi:homoserine kinase [Desulfurobacterium pacificum]|jgi:homoserine kinase|uniref:Homoserine kinase n=1 Tax=Desulfurobacterium pacificum TaxID=240166 RepID=A0ABY1NNF0_9BACT|nr:homoserine kinase [Desulfurobacterium pacificum]SMP12107.1 homoserine kinase [Desulfurobacterium pacificum]